MKSLRVLLEAYQKQAAVAWHLIEQDYALSWMLYGISQIPLLRDCLVFKGGTCLKKCYFGNYRFSQDLDFSVLGDCPTSEMFDTLINQAAEIASRELARRDHKVVFETKRYQEKSPHPDNQEAFVISVHYPWQRSPLTTIMVEITTAEVVALPVHIKPLIHTYDDSVDCLLTT